MHDLLAILKEDILDFGYPNYETSRYHKHLLWHFRNGYSDICTKSYSVLGKVTTQHPPNNILI